MCKTPMIDFTGSTDFIEISDLVPIPPGFTFSIPIDFIEIPDWEKIYKEKRNENIAGDN